MRVVCCSMMEMFFEITKSFSHACAPPSLHSPRGLSPRSKTLYCDRHQLSASGSSNNHQLRGEKVYKRVPVGRH
jgi:hypothetical protein